MSQPKDVESNATVSLKEKLAPEPAAPQLSAEEPRYFVLRTLISISIPPALAAYYIWTYTSYLRPGSHNTSDSSKIPNGKLLWWSWFVIGAIGLNVSNYSLAGIEAGLLMSKHFKVDADQLHWHTGSSWSTLAGWWEFILVPVSWVFRKSCRRRRPSVPWLILFGLSVLSWAFVLSGLTMETSTGFVADRISGASVSGVNQTTLNARQPSTVVDDAFQSWKMGTQAEIPRWGALYTLPGSTITVNTSTPNTLPRNTTEEIFLTPQGEAPLVGSAWGLLLKYSCTGVHRLSDFTILNQRMNSTDLAYVRNFTAVFGSSPENAAIGGDDVNYFYDVSTDATINIPTQERSVYGGFDAVDVMEFLLWQSPVNAYFNATAVADPIPGLDTEHLDPFRRSMSAIGVRCTSSSATGAANINGFTGIFNNFQDSDPDDLNVYSVPRLSRGAAIMLLQGNMNVTNWPDDIYNPDSFITFPAAEVDYTLVGRNINWMNPLFTAAGVPSVLGNAALVNGYLSCMQTADLQRGLEEAYKHYALQIMFSGQESDEDVWTNPSVTAAKKWPILVGGGGVPPLLVLAFLAVWAGGCAGLGLVYGLRKRWASTFNGYAFRRYCVETGSDPGLIFEK
ncbi:hypothetical protein G7Y89_g15634 [Cudoniella acicularis]|uniref:Uncharacterized protein n=1 Tax=Cudoniella acicularis TaxID=354080 RepID=A0A8H4QIJ0_9HELO|nr:hypothetical protein G7Y89_g15634 [Cudoniella acicularis]